MDDDILGEDSVEAEEAVAEVERLRAAAIAARDLLLCVDVADTTGIGVGEGGAEEWVTSTFWKR